MLFGAKMDYPLLLFNLFTVFSVTRFGDLLHFGQVFKAFGNN